MPASSRASQINSSGPAGRRPRSTSARRRPVVSNTSRVTSAGSRRRYGRSTRSGKGFGYAAPIQRVGVEGSVGSDARGTLPKRQICSAAPNASESPKNANRLTVWPSSPMAVHDSPPSVVTCAVPRPPYHPVCSETKPTPCIERVGVATRCQVWPPSVVLITEPSPVPPLVSTETYPTSGVEKCNFQPHSPLSVLRNRSVQVAPPSSVPRIMTLPDRWPVRKPCCRSRKYTSTKKSACAERSSEVQLTPESSVRRKCAPPMIAPAA